MSAIPPISAALPRTIAPVVRTRVVGPGRPADGAEEPSSPTAPAKARAGKARTRSALKTSAPGLSPGFLAALTALKRGG